MRTIYTICLIMTVLGALGAASHGSGSMDLLPHVFGEDRTVGGDFLRIIMAISAVVTLVRGLRSTAKAAA